MIRPMQTSDISAVRELHRLLLQPPALSPKLRTVSQALLVRVMSAKDHHEIADRFESGLFEFLVASIGSEGKRRVVAYSQFSRAEGSPAARIHEFIVDQNFRGKGIGSKLLEATIRRLEDMGTERVVLTATDAGASMYKHHGFVSIGGDDSRDLVRTLL